MPCLHTPSSLRPRASLRPPPSLRKRLALRPRIRPVAPVLFSDSAPILPRCSRASISARTLHSVRDLHPASALRSRLTSPASSLRKRLAFRPYPALRPLALLCPRPTLPPHSSRVLRLVCAPCLACTLPSYSARALHITHPCPLKGGTCKVKRLSPIIQTASQSVQVQFDR